MNCSRCRGFMVEDDFLDFEGQFREMCATIWHRVNCSRVHDPVIGRNRLAREEKVVCSSEPDYEDDEVHLGAESFIKRAA